MEDFRDDDDDAVALPVAGADDEDDAEMGGDAPAPAGPNPRIRSDLPVINIGEGDLNADWIKHVDGGRHQRNEFRAHEMLLIQYYEREGRTQEAEAAKLHLEELGPWETSKGEGDDGFSQATAGDEWGDEDLPAAAIPELEEAIDDDEDDE